MFESVGDQLMPMADVDPLAFKRNNQTTGL